MKEYGLIENGNCGFGVETCKWDCKNVKGYEGGECLEDDMCYCCIRACKNPFNLEACDFDVDTCKWHCSATQNGLGPNYELAACINDQCYCCDM